MSTSSQTFKSYIEINFLSQKIIGKRTNEEGVVQYKVKWLGYPIDESTWQPIGNLEFVKALLRQYDEKIQPISFYQQNEEKTKAQFAQYDEDQPFQDDNGEQFQFQEEENNRDQQYQEEEEVVSKPLKRLTKNVKQMKNPKKQWNQQQKEQGLDIEEQSLSFDDIQEESQEPKPRKLKRQQQRAIRPIPQYQQKNGVSFPKNKSNLNLPAQKQPFLQQVQKRTQFIIKSPPARSEQIKLPNTLKILQISRCQRTNQQIYLTQRGPLIAYRTHNYMFNNYPAQLIRFYECQIQFAKIPKI